MTILSEFVDRNRIRLGAHLAGRVAVFAAMGLAAGIAAYSPVASAFHQAATPGSEIAMTLSAHAARISDRLHDMAIIQKALHEDPGLQTPGTAATRQLAELANRLHADTPSPELADIDLGRLDVPAGSQSLSETVDHLNAQKRILSEASAALQEVFHSIGHGGPRLERGIARLDQAVSGYKGMQGEMKEAVRGSLERLKAEPSVPALGL